MRFCKWHLWGSKFNFTIIFFSSFILAFDGTIQFRGCSEIMKKISTLHFGKIIMNSYSSDFCDPLPIPDKIRFYTKIGFYVAGCFVCFGLRLLISFIKKSLIKKSNLKLRISKIFAQLLVVSIIIALVCCAVYELISYLSFDKNFKTLVLNLM